MDNNKELVSGDELFPLVKGWVKQVASSRLDIQLETSSFLKDNRVWFYLTDTNFGNMYRYIAVTLIEDHWVIYNDWYAEEFINIRIFKDNIEFNEDSVFADFTRDEMHNLYTLLKERIFGNNTERLPEIIKDPTNVNIFKHIKSVMQRYPEDSPEYKVLYDLYNTIRCSFNTKYGMSVNAPKPDYEALITHATNLVNNFDKETQSSDDIKEDK